MRCIQPQGAPGLEADLIIPLPGDFILFLALGEAEHQDPGGAASSVAGITEQLPAVEVALVFISLKTELARLPAVDVAGIHILSLLCRYACTVIE
jgi:hypothetical protein